MKTIELTTGKKVQRKGSNVIWTITGHNNKGLAEGQTYPCYPAKDLGIEGATKIHITCIAKRNGEMSKWIDRDGFMKNWEEV
ncbi:hypothetical protein [Arthrobacter sp. AL12]|uniref:hypothetical protein n=1 Tax=Arthrobacter sp. AL12 TaxID=3042241 RepID=UPI00249C5A75|nr:hypothetical protein [Arthrobacter sp. AL12]MDI3211786.1 hypothetical protein [Arthrobacter sp. AL12]